MITDSIKLRIKAYLNFKENFIEPIKTMYSYLVMAYALWAYRKTGIYKEVIDEIIRVYAPLRIYRWGCCSGFYASDYNRWFRIPNSLINKTFHIFRRNYAKTVSHMGRQYTPEKITKLEENEIFVFGSDLRGIHTGGAALTAKRKFGAIMGQGEGLQGQSYGIPTMHGPAEEIKPFVDRFIEFAKRHPELTFYVTRIGCGKAKFKVEDMASLFKDAYDLKNVILPFDFVQYLYFNK